MHDLLIATLLGIVEGITEFLPVSSTGHLIISGHLLGFVGDEAASFEVIIQLGAILSVVLLYWRRFVGLIPASVKAFEASNLEGWSGLWRIALATFPALVVGYGARHVIKEQLFNPSAVTLALAIGGIAILLVERYAAKRKTNSLERLTLPQALGVGLFQVLALWPGTSRAAATIVGGMLLGLDRKSAAEFSFLIAVPVMLAASGYELIKMRDEMALQNVLQLGVGFVISFIVALITVKVFVSFLQRGKLTPFAWYRILVAPIFYFLTRGLKF
ncbi:MAG TPA: undecaprenyl-diphosphate phosphatase [Candidatus Binatia bacterium]|jgi:undecaprenyl-diphosphatase|nr:undecaprenyl-diphosphate phosphatase [Candidatus Binatia bacterium]